MNITIGALAHVDAGKTSLAESILYLTKTIRSKGKIDNSNTFLDYNPLEKQKGITIYNKIAQFKYGNNDYYYLDTPGHNELANESRRAISILDAAILIIDGNDSIPIDSIKLFNNLKDYNIPILIFVNKMDITPFDSEYILKNVQNKLDINCLLYSDIYEPISLQSEQLMNEYLNTGSLNDEVVINALRNNVVYPCFFGSALKDIGVKELLDFISKYIKTDYDENANLNAYIYKHNNDYTYLKVLSGTLKNKQAFNEYKVNEIYSVNGNNFTAIQNCKAGQLCAIKGLQDIQIGTYLPSFNIDISNDIPSLQYRIISNLDSNDLYKKLQPIILEQPELKIKHESRNIYMNLNGELHELIVSNLIKERLNIDVSFSEPIIKYKETIKDETIGVGHFEPLRHYGEVIVKLKPSDRYIVSSKLDNKYISSILSYLKTYPIRGILTNSPLMNVEIEILDIKTHPKHTEGHDLIEATRRAIRQSLTKIDSIIMEPSYITTISTNDENTNTIISFLTNQQLTFTIEENNILVSIPLKAFNNTITNLKSKLKGNLNFSIEEMTYTQADNQEEIIKLRHYDYLCDEKNPAGSVFCSHGAGHYVQPEDVEANMHLNINDYLDKTNSASFTYNKTKISDDELKRVWNSIYKPKPIYLPKNKKQEEERIYKPKPSKPIIYMIDGYNLMYRLNEDDAINDFSNARDNTINLVCDFAGYVAAQTILVFDAYISNGQKYEISNYDNITIVYTKEKQTADTYIEQKSQELKKDYKVIVVTSDNLEQLRVYANDSSIISSSEFLHRYENFKKNNTKLNKPFIVKPFEELKQLLIDNEMDSVD